ncbi:hypothetical protein [Varibaculum vaginae]|uniref:hypothetical protein n=1 Tax=Varibaculum vaginae TaxID=2364797 RepID=UPI000F07A247|nr:hypothetical protein [Varibaculum vaginae]
MSDTPLTDTSTFARIETGKIPAVRITEQGLQTQKQAAAINPGASYMGSQGLLKVGDFSAVGCKQLVVFPAEVTPEEVEALAVSLWEDAGWVAPGRLRLSGSAALNGPFSLDQKIRESLQLPAQSQLAFYLECPRQRGGELAKDLRGIDSLTDAFAASEPIGLEDEILRGLLAICRRLGGSLRVGPGNRAVDSPAQILSPDPDSAVNLTVYSPYWIEKTSLKKLLEPVMGELHTNPGSPERPRRSQRRFAQEAEALVTAQLGAEKLAWIAAEAAAFDKEVGNQIKHSNAFALYGSRGAGADFFVGVETSVQVPLSLRFHPNHGQPFAIYQLQWLGESPGNRRLSRVERVARMKVINMFEDAARLLAQVAAGTVIDEDSFLVTWN